MHNFKILFNNFCAQVLVLPNWELREEIYTIAFFWNSSVLRREHHFLPSEYGSDAFIGLDMSWQQQSVLQPCPYFHRETPVRITPGEKTWPQADLTVSEKTIATQATRRAGGWNSNSSENNYLRVLEWNFRSIGCVFSELELSELQDPLQAWGWVRQASRAVDTSRSRD